MQKTFHKKAFMKRSHEKTKMYLESIQSKVADCQIDPKSMHDKF